MAYGRDDFIRPSKPEAVNSPLPPSHRIVECAFGKFLYSNTDPAVRNSAHWRTCLDLHSRFHQSAARVLQLAVNGNKEAAKKEMDPQSEFIKLSRTLTAEMLKWQAGK